MSLDKLLDKIEGVIRPQKPPPDMGAIRAALEAMANGTYVPPGESRELTEEEKESPLYQMFKRLADADVGEFTDGHVTVAAVTKTESMVAVVPVERKPVAEPFPAETPPVAEVADEPTPQAKPKTREPAVTEAALEAMWRRPRSGSPFSDTTPSRTIVISLDQYRK